MSNDTTASANNFLHAIIDEDLASGKHQEVVTRFPPEPNGFLHIGHAHSICVNFGLAMKYQGRCNLRFDDTNPEKESQEFIDAIQEDVKWLGFDWAGDVRYSSDYFDTLYDYAIYLIKAGNAYVCDLNAEQAKEYRGNLKQPGKNSPYRERSVEENLALFEKMRDGGFEEGACALRAKIDMSSPNMNMRDPIIYRIRKVPHHQTGDKWCIYPIYDFTHGQSDALEGITHSICTLEFEGHRPLYEWFIENLPVPSQPKQYEFSRLNINYTVTSKRKLKSLVDEGVVEGWDDPRMPTISGMRRRGYSAQALRNFSEMVGVNRAGGIVDMGMLEHAIRTDLNDNAPRAMCVMNAVKLSITNFDQAKAMDGVEMMTQPCHPNKPEMGERQLPFTETLYIDRADFTEDTTLSRKKFKRLVFGEYVRLRGGYVIKAEEVVKDEQGTITEIKASLVPGTVGETPPEGVKPRGVIHWVSATLAQKATVRIYERLFDHEAPDFGGRDYMAHLTDNSLHALEGCWVEPSLANTTPEQSFQFEREGYFVADRYEYGEGRLVFNKTISLVESKSKK
ncbi:glutaminyl-tRNA synthetase [Sinobacterium caligoides]|uniref:Glutamine--tRNA ligase n=1 Tax=Sinobacterium caligoides TaxID=933926 RepID=A0A3N2DZC5_9GAMM|nr:glutamine--tRNA ligase/YqeY domain fusion protein [Sinobacterium caligoides]ROS04655.1 glutaminyl-tRNA synthetase [Sinobacterium caligoides]